MAERVARRGTWVAASAVCGVVFALCMPPVNAVVLVWPALAGLAYALGEGASPRGGQLARILEGSLRGLVFGVGIHVVSLRFLPGVVAHFTSTSVVAGLVVLLIVGLVQGIPWAALAMIRARLVAWRVPPWLAFGIAGYASAFVPTIFPWSPAGLLTPWPAVVQLADLVGERGVSLLTFLSAGLLADAARVFARRRKASREVLVLAAGALLLPVMQAAYGAARIASIESWRASFPTARVGLVSPGFEALERWDGAESPALLERLTALTRESEQRGAQLTVWTEAAHPYALGHGRLQGPGGAQAILQPGVHGPVLLGALTISEAGEAYNSALVAYPGGTISDSYDKIHLLWFGETVPLGEWIPWLKKVFLRGTGLAAGVHSEALDAGAVRAGILICYEDTLTGAGREAAAANPNLLVNLTNDAWFAGSWESDNQLRLAAMRSVEARRDLVRAVNGGSTSWVDAAGIVRARASQEAGVTIAEPALVEGGLTLYTRLGNLPLVAILAVIVLRLRRARTQAATGASVG